METQKHIIIFSHGFGVRKDDLGMLDDIASVFTEAESILFDYFMINDNQKTLTVTKNLMKFMLRPGKDTLKQL